MSGFIELADHPRAAALAKLLCAHQQKITRDGIDLAWLGAFKPWDDAGINNGGWYTCGLKWQGKPLDGHDRTIAGRIAAGDDAIFNAGYSLMMPGAEIAHHVGYSSEVLRLHVGLVVPEGDCALIVGGEERRWESGEALLFDDTVLHSAHNRTGHLRLILLLDIAKGAP